jgi:tRNA (pseudouridine54-N1)-methyltransferase
MSTSGIFVRTGGLAEVLANLSDAKLIYMRENGADIRGLGEDCQGGSSLSGEAAFILGDHTGMTPDEESLIEQAGAKVVPLGPTSLHADHCIVLLNWFLDTNVFMQG